MEFYKQTIQMGTNWEQRDEQILASGYAYKLQVVSNNWYF